jgi:hypothetical protein
LRAGFAAAAALMATWPRHDDLTLDEDLADRWRGRLSKDQRQHGNPASVMPWCGGES